MLTRFWCVARLISTVLARYAIHLKKQDLKNARSQQGEELHMASKSADVRPKITMACVDCKERNYITRKNRRNDPDRLEIKKYCPRCKASTLHRETR